MDADANPVLGNPIRCQVLSGLPEAIVAADSPRLAQDGQELQPREFPRDFDIGSVVPHENDGIAGLFGPVAPGDKIEVPARRESQTDRAVGKPRKLPARDGARILKQALLHVLPESLGAR